MRYYTQLTLEQRYQIQAVLKTVYPYTKIARVLGVHPSTISREIQPNLAIYNNGDDVGSALNKRSASC